MCLQVRHHRAQIERHDPVEGLGVDLGDGHVTERRARPDIVVQDVDRPIAIGSALPSRAMDASSVLRSQGVDALPSAAISSAVSLAGVEIAIDANHRRTLSA